ncbi:MAG TPA: hypothetical protein VI670_07205 [Thermoanaerobaculia bacterium]|jgi:hypothetical protein
MNIPDTLRQHDPASGKSLTAFDRTRILERARATPPRRLRWAWALLTIVAIAAAVVVRRPTPPEHPPARQIQCTTPGGTRIVWTLDPDFHM